MLRCHFDPYEKRKSSELRIRNNQRFLVYLPLYAHFLRIFFLQKTYDAFITIVLFKRFITTTIVVDVIPLSSCNILCF